MMLWIILLSVAVSLMFLSKNVAEEVYSLAVRVTSAISFIWGFAWAPPSAQLLIASVLGSMVFFVRRVSS